MLHFLHRIFVQGNNKLIKCILIEFSVNCFYFECIQTFKFEEYFFVLRSKKHHITYSVLFCAGSY